MAKKRQSVVPAKVQLPLTGLLIVVFGVVLFWRFAPGKESAAIAIVEKGISTLVSFSEIEDLESLIEAVEQNALIGDSKSESGSRLERDPFVKARAFSPGPTQETGEGIESELISEEGGEKVVNRSEFLEEASLTAVITMGNRSVAVLDGQYLRIGNTIAGLTVTEIAEDHIVLKDELGSEVVRLEELWRNANKESGERSTLSLKDGEL